MELKFPALYLMVGYAPGGYMVTERYTGNTIHGVDKRAWCGKEYADTMIAHYVDSVVSEYRFIKMRNGLPPSATTELEELVELESTQESMDLKDPLFEFVVSDRVRNVCDYVRYNEEN